MIRKKFTRILVAAMFLLHLPLQAEDIDLFSLPPGTGSGVANVLFLIDNTANWNGPFTNEKTALVNVFNALPTNTDGTARVNVGIMLFTETGNPNNNVDGGYIRAAIRPMNTANRAKYSALINSFDKNADKSNGGKAGKTMAEAYYYFSSTTPYSGNSKAKTDYTGNTSGTAVSNAVYALTGNALSSFAGTQYAGPTGGACANNYIIYISNGAAQDNSSDNSTATTLLSNAGGSTSTISISPSGSQSNVADEWARWMKQSPQKITIYTLDIDKVTNGQGPGWTAMLKSMAGVSGGKYFDVSSGVAQNIADALNTVLGEILAANSVFASVSLPASANAQSTFLNQVFIGMFRPDSDALPRWNGNLKHYKLGVLNGDIKLLDANGNGAININQGFITECARSYWTPSAVDTYWTFKPQGECATVANSKNSNYPDGPIVEKGAQGYVLRSSPSRTVYTCSPTFASCTSLTNFSAGPTPANNLDVTQALLMASSPSQRDEVINWARGLDVKTGEDERLNGITSAEMRASVHGDVVHSRPVAVNYGGDDYLGTNASVADAQVVVYYSGNDGMLRAINGNRTANIGTVTPGKEIWSFVPPEFWGYIKRIYDNTVKISYPAITTGSPEPKRYGIDGPITSFKGAIGGVDKVYIYAGMRRGGRALYAFDVTTPASPSLKWKRGCPNVANDTGCSSGWEGIGQTWSAATPVKAAGHSVPVLIMGGGYDNCEDYDGGSGGATHNCSTTKGNKIFVVDGDTGALLKTFTTERGVAGAVMPAQNEAGNIQFAYAVDMGGNVYRISGASANAEIGSATADSWTMTKIASLGCNNVNSCTQPRKFLFGPDVVANAGGGFAILVGSGDREKPLTSYLAANEVQNHFFVVQDQPEVADWLTQEEPSDRCNAAVMCLASLAQIPSNSNPTSADMAGKKGWYLPLAATEHVVTSAITVSNRLVFSTFKPAVYDANACGANLGTANVYNVNYLNAAPLVGDSRFQQIVGGGLPPSPVAGKVILDDGTEVPFLIGGSAYSPLEATNPSAAVDFEMPKSRVYWRIEK